MRERTKLRQALKQQVLHEGGYKCGNPTCRTILTLHFHHIWSVSEGGPDTPGNLIALCPNCHSQHHDGIITLESVKAWKMLQLSLNEGFDRRSVDVLLAMPQIEELSVTGDGFIQIAGLVTAGYLAISVQTRGIANSLGVATFTVRLTEKGKLFVEAWKKGDQQAAVLAGGKKRR